MASQPSNEDSFAAQTKKTGANKRMTSLSKLLIVKNSAILIKNQDE